MATKLVVSICEPDVLWRSCIYLAIQTGIFHFTQIHRCGSFFFVKTSEPPEDGNLSVPASAPEKEEEFQEPSNTSFAEFNLVAQLCESQRATLS